MRDFTFYIDDDYAWECEHKINYLDISDDIDGSDNSNVDGSKISNEILYLRNTKKDDLYYYDANKLNYCKFNLLCSDNNKFIYKKVSEHHIKNDENTK